MARRNLRDQRDVHQKANAEITVFAEQNGNRVGVPVWQTVGTKLEGEILNGQQALERSGALWKVRKDPVYTKTGETFIEIPDYKAIVREDTGKVLGQVGKKYTPLQNEEAIKVLDPIVAAGIAEYDSVGQVYGGEIFWTMLKLKEDLVLPGNDRVMQYLMFLNSHNGSFSLRIFPTPMRAWCANVLASLLGRDAKNGIAIRHTRSAEARMEEAKHIIEATRGFYNDFGKLANKLALQAMSDNQMKALAEHLFPAVENENGELKVSTRAQNMRDEVQKLFVEGAGHEGIRGSAWAGLNAVAEYADHHRSIRVGEGNDEGEARFDSVMFGTGLALKSKAYNWISEKLAA